MDATVKPPKPRKPAGIIDRIAVYQPQLTDTETAYLAGIIDGEGTISIIRSVKRRTSQQTYYILIPVLSVTNTSLTLFSWLHDKLGMVVNARTRPELSERPCMQITLMGYRCYNLIKAVRPYLIIKSPQADTVMQFIEERMSQEYNAVYSEAEIKLWLKCRSLNRKGWRKYPEKASLIESSTI